MQVNKFTRFYFFTIPFIIFILSGCLLRSSGVAGHPVFESPTPKTVVKIDLKSSLDKDGRVKISWDFSGMEIANRNLITLLRSTSNLGLIEIDPVAYPITCYPLKKNQDENSFTDLYTSDNTLYYYLLEVTEKTGEKVYSSVTSIKTADREIRNLKRPIIFIDKIHYFLEVSDGGKTIKRYPVVLGRNPIKRKLHQDNSCTPEGFYKINDLQPKATYHKAYDLSYPNDIDKFRYRFAMTENLLPKIDGNFPDIGGEIQIHGWGIPFNLTFGCIALRNEDMDELFDHPQIGRGTSVIITGSELTSLDLDSIKKKRSPNEIKIIQKKLKKAGFDPGQIDGQIGNQTMKALGRYQVKNNLPITCQLDMRTIESLDAIKLDK